jgi:hypothetical protein
MFQASNPLSVTYNDPANTIQISLNQNQIDHTQLMNVGTNNHFAIDNHISNVNNPHSVTKQQVGLGQVDNTSDINKTISNATQNALNLKQDFINAGGTGQYYRGDKTFQDLNKIAVGLSNIDNTSDLNKPISNLTQTALNLKYDSSNPSGFETPTQLNTRDTNNRNRANHFGSQLASSISDFTEATQDASASLITSGTHVGISVNYNDAGNTLSFTNTDRGSTSVATHEGLADPHPQYLTSAEGNAAYQPLDSDLTAVAGLATTGFVTRTGTGSAATRTITQGAGIAVTNGDGLTGNPVISTTITQYTDELAQDAIASAFAAGTQTGITVTYNDAGNSLSLTNADRGTVAVSTHEGLADPHPQYLTNAEANLLYAGINHTHPNATTSVAGFMSPGDKTKLDGLTSDVVLKSSTIYTNTSNATFVDVANLAITVVSGRVYTFQYLLRYQSTSGATGIAIGIAGTATGDITARVSINQNNGTAALFAGPLINLTSFVQSTSVLATNTNYLTTITGIFVATGNGQIYPRFRSETNGTQVSVRDNSICTFKEIL